MADRKFRAKFEFIGDVEGQDALDAVTNAAISLRHLTYIDNQQQPEISIMCELPIPTETPKPPASQPDSVEAEAAEPGF